MRVTAKKAVFWLAFRARKSRPTMQRSSQKGAGSALSHTRKLPPRVHPHMCVSSEKAACLHVFPARKSRPAMRMSSQKARFCQFLVPENCLIVSGLAPKRRFFSVSATQKSAHIMQIISKKDVALHVPGAQKSSPPMRISSEKVAFYSFPLPEKSRPHMRITQKIVQVPYKGPSSRGPF